MRTLFLLALLGMPSMANAACPAISKLAGATFVCTLHGELGGQTHFGSATHATSRAGITTVSNWVLFASDTITGPTEEDSGTVTVTSNAQYSGSCTLVTSTAFASGLSSTNVASFVNNGNQLEIRGVRSDGLVFRGTCIKP